MEQVINSCLTAFNSIGRGFCSYTAGIFVQSSVLIVLLLIIDFLLRKRVRAVFRYCVWMLVFVKLMLPPTLSLPTGIGYWSGDYLSADWPVLQQVSNMVRPEPAIAPAPEDFALAAEVAQDQPSQTNPQIAAPVTSAVSGLETLTWQAVVFGLWLVGVIVISVLLVQRMLFVRRMITQSEPVNNRLPDMLNQCRRQVGIGRNIELRLTNNISGPAVCGLFKPVILIPTALLEKLSPDRLRAVLIHELVHIKRADIWVNLVQTVLQIIYFYNPFVWLANAVVRRIREQAVDEMVLVALGAGAKSYSNTLIDIAEMAFFRTSMSLRLIGVVESKKALHRRIKLMLNRPVPKNAKLGVLGLVVVIIIGAILLPMAKAQKQSVVKPAESTESTKVDIAIEDKDLTVTKLSDGLFEAGIVLRNKGSVPIPPFSVYFYAGDPDKGGRLLSHPSQSAGPIMPGDRWAEGIHPHRLKPGEDVISVVVDPDNKVEESDETNNKASQTLSKIVSESEEVDKVGAIQKVDLAGDDILQVEAQTVEGFNFPYYLFIPSGIDKDKQVYMLVETNNSGMVSDDLEVHQVRALMLVKKSHANQMARRLGVPLLVPTFPRPRPETHWWAYTHALDIDTLEIEEGKLKRIDLQLTAMIKHAQELLRINGFTINDRIFMHGFSASAKFCNRYSFLHPEMVKAAAAGGVNGLPTLPVREWNGYELPFPIGIAGIERFTGKPFDERAFKQVAHYIYMGSSDRNDTLLSREAWREEEADIIRKALAAEKMMPDRWELSRKIYRQQKLPAQLVTYNGVGHAIKGEMQDDVIDFFKANSGEKYVRIKPYEYIVVKSKEILPKDKTESAKIDIAIEDKNLTVTEQPDGSFRAEIAIYNKGSYPLPQFGVNFYAGDPDKGGRLLESHAAGPIMPGDGWGEYNPRLKLRPGENTISVVVDPGNKVEESDETNNKASKTISTTVDKDNSQPSDRPSTLASKPPQLQTRMSEFVAILSNGVTVELLGVCEHPSEGKQWWRPDGSLIDKAPYKTMGSKLKRIKGYNYYEFVVRLKGPSGTSYEWQIPSGKHSTDTGAPIDENGERVSDLRVYTTNQLENKTTALVRIGLSADKWQTLASHPVNIPEETYTLEDGKNAIAFGRAYEKEGQTIVPLAHTLNRGLEKKALRLVAVTKNGEEIPGSSWGRSGNILSSNTYGFDLSLQNIKEFRFQTRPYQWVEFKDVSLRPGYKTNVQF